MRGAVFLPLLTGTLSSACVWERSLLCPCVQPDGYVDPTCQVCFGKGRYFDPPSSSFQCGVVNLSAKALEAIQQRFGPGMKGDSQMSIPFTAPCYAEINEGDRVAVTTAVDVVEWSLAPGDQIKLPFGYSGLDAKVRNPAGDTVLTTPFPVPGAGGRVTVTVPTALRFSAPRRYEVLKELSHTRGFSTGEGLPKKMLLSLIDWTVRW